MDPCANIAPLSKPFFVVCTFCPPTPSPLFFPGPPFCSLCAFVSVHPSTNRWTILFSCSFHGLHGPTPPHFEMLNLLNPLSLHTSFWLFVVFDDSKTVRSPTHIAWCPPPSGLDLLSLSFHVAAEQSSLSCLLFFAHPDDSKVAFTIRSGLFLARPYTLDHRTTPRVFHSPSPVYPSIANNLGSKTSQDDLSYVFPFPESVGGRTSENRCHSYVWGGELFRLSLLSFTYFLK